MTRTKKSYNVTVPVWKIPTGSVYHTYPDCIDLPHALRPKLEALGTLTVSTAQICGGCRKRYIWERYGDERRSAKIAKLAQGHAGALVALEAISPDVRHGYWELQTLERLNIMGEDLWRRYQAAGENLDAFWKEIASVSIL